MSENFNLEVIWDHPDRSVAEKLFASLLFFLTKWYVWVGIVFLVISIAFGDNHSSKYVGDWEGGGFHITLYDDGTGTLKLEDVSRNFRWDELNWKPNEAEKASGYVANDFAHIHGNEYVTEIFLMEDGGWYFTHRLKPDEKPAKKLKKQ